MSTIKEKARTFDVVFDTLLRHPYIVIALLCALLLPFGFAQASQIAEGHIAFEELLWLFGMVALTLFGKPSKSFKINLYLLLSSAVMILLFSLMVSENPQHAQMMFILVGVGIFQLGAVMVAEKSLKTDRLILLMMVLGVVVRYCYVLRYDYTQLQHDVGSFEGTHGHASYIMYWYENGLKLPDFDVSTRWQFYHPPLHHLLMALLMSVTAVLTGLLASRVSAGVGRRLRESIYEKVMKFTNAEMEKFSTASLITRSTNDIQQVQFVIVMLLRMVAYAPILAAFGIVKVIRTRSGMSWIIVVAVIALSALIGILLAVAMPKFKKMQTLVDRLNLVSRELLTGIMPIRAFSREAHEEKRFEKASRDLYETQLFTNRTMSIMMPVMMFIMNGVSVLIVWVGAGRVDLGTIQVGDLTAFVTYSMVIVIGFLMMSMVSILLPRAGIAADRIAEVLDTPVSLIDPDQPRDGEAREGSGRLAFQDVQFTYPGAEAPALADISFTASPGEVTAIIGSTGCGKTTLVNLIPRFFDVTQGQITLDGVDIRQLSQKYLRDQIGYVPQKGMLFTGTIESNIKYGGDQITDEDMKEAARIAQAEEFILEKKEGYGYDIAQEGANVSGGQRQRLSIARAIAKHPKIYVFDDSFSALDYKTDLVLRTELMKYTGDSTVIIVAQRISTVLHADKILCMEEGRIVGQGTHEELMKSCPTYREIAQSQLSEAELASMGGED